jgi:hypothetical protein
MNDTTDQELVYIITVQKFDLMKGTIEVVIE